MAAPKPKENTKAASLDETQWRSPAFAQSLGGIHTNSIHHYFAASPFFDKMSNNGFLLNQARFNGDMFGVVQTREAFEAQLRGMQGVEFMVAFEPSPTESESESVWVIRKQIRKKRDAGTDGSDGSDGSDDSVDVLAAYFVVGESVYMAPSVGNVVATRMLHALTSLTKFLSTASALPIFTPSRGYTYLPPAAKAASIAGVASTAGTATFPGTQTAKEVSTPSRQGSVAPPHSTTGSGAAISAADRTAYATLAESLALSLRYYNPTTGQGTDSYMDENPLVGEPGSFIFTSTQSKAAAAAAAAAARQSAKAGTGATASTAGGATAAQQVAAAAKKGGAGAKEKSPTSPTIPGGKPKRRKSKAAAGMGPKA